MRDSRGRSPRPVPAARALAGLKARIEPDTPLARVQAVWPTAVGERIAAVTQVSEEVEGIIYVECRSAVWSQELSLMEPRLREILDAALDADVVREIRFRTVS